MKDFFSVNEIEIVKGSDYRAQLIERINQLINGDFNGLIQILYRIDINEARLKELLETHKATDAAEIIADLVIERQLQKLKSRQQFRQRDNDISEEEKW